MKDTTKEALRNYLLNNEEDALAIAREADGYDGRFDYTRTYDIDELAEIMTGSDLARAIIYGKVRSIDSPARFNGYGNLETADEWDLLHETKEFYIEDIIYAIEDIGDYIDLPYEVEEILNASIAC